MSASDLETVSFIGSEGNRLAATSYGAPAAGHPPALFMHGGGQTRFSWHRAALDLAKLGVSSFTADARGHGDSDWVTSKNYSFFHFRDDLIALVDQITRKHNAPPILIGASMGGVSGMLAIDKEGANIFSAVVFVDITPTMAPSGVDKIQGFMAANMRDGFATIEDAADVIAAYLPNRPRPKSLDGLRKNLRQRDDGRFYWHWDPAFMDGPASIDTGRGQRGQILQDCCRKITCPALLVRGRDSELVTEEAVEEFKELVPHSRFVDVSGAGHMVAGDRNDVFASAVIDFLKTDVLNTA